MGCGWGRELVLQLGKVFHRIRVRFLHKLFCFVFKLVLF